MILSREKNTSFSARMKGVLLALLLVLSCSASAAVVGTLYQGEVPVASYSQADWQKALTPALWQVLVKVTGNPKIAQAEGVRKAIGRPDALVQSYNYTTLDQAGKAVPTLQVRFSPKAVDAVLQKAGQKILPKDRPLTLVWLVMSNAQGQAQVLTDPKDPLVAGLQQQADALALPMLWPTLDASNVSPEFAADVANFNSNTITQASQQYQADNILVGSVSKAPNSPNWQVQWRWLAGVNASPWQTQGVTPNVAVNAVTSSWVQQMAVAPTVAATDPNASNTPNAPDVAGQGSVVKMEVLGVRGLADYTALLDYLKSSSLVASIDTLQMNDTRLVLAVTLNGSRSAFVQALASNNRLESQMADFGNGVTESSTLRYRWVAQDVLATSGASANGVGTNSDNNSSAVQSFAAPAVQ
jgi:hypothetical protein